MTTISVALQLLDIFLSNRAHGVSWAGELDPTYQKLKWVQFCLTMVTLAAAFRVGRLTIFGRMPNEARLPRRIPQEVILPPRIPREIVLPPLEGIIVVEIPSPQEGIIEAENARG